VVFEDHRDHEHIGGHGERHDRQVEDDQQVIGLAAEPVVEIPQYVAHDVHLHRAVVVEDRWGGVGDVESRRQGRRRRRRRRRNAARSHRDLLKDSRRSSSAVVAQEESGDSRRACEAGPAVS